MLLIGLHLFSQQLSAFFSNWISAMFNKIIHPNQILIFVPDKSSKILKNSTGLFPFCVLCNFHFCFTHFFIPTYDIIIILLIYRTATNKKEGKEKTILLPLHFYFYIPFFCTYLLLTHSTSSLVFIVYANHPRMAEREKALE